MATMLAPKAPCPTAARNGKESTGRMWRTAAQRSDQEILDWAQRKVEENRSRYPSDSELELGLCFYVLVGTKGDKDRADGIVRGSGQLREKGRTENWDRKIGNTTYGKLTMEKALTWYLLDPRTTKETRERPGQSHAARLDARNGETKRSR